MKITKFMALTMTALISTTAAQAADLWKLSGFESPESVLFDAKDAHVFVSNIVGAPTDLDGNGYISRISPDGKLLEQKWATGLNAPKGMAVVGGDLLVADIAQLRVIDLATGKLKTTLDLEGAQFLNDVVASGDGAYISDMLGNSIWSYADGKAEVWVKDVSAPNGLLVDGGKLLVASIGEGLKADLSSEKPGSLLAIDLTSKEITVVSKEIGSLDGVAHIGDEILLSDWKSNALTSVDKDGKTRLVLQDMKGLADIFADGNTLYMPQMIEGTVTAISYP